jgi:ribosomal protein L18
MRRLITAAAIFFSLTVAASVQASEALKAIVDSYLEIHAQLASDKTDGVKASAAALAAKAETMGPSGAAMAKAAKAVGSAADIKAARDAFGPLSDAVIAAARGEKFKDVSDVKVTYCPMVKKSWLQKEDQIKNPYYGAQMLTCGEFKK